MGGSVEYVFVRFDPNDQRQVLADGNPVGLTGVGLTLESDFYVITLSGDHYSPPQWTGPISGTSPHNPLNIAFTRV
jgi:hypothetical protein